MGDRTATLSRKTNETEIEVYVNLDCQPGSASQQVIDISTGIGFLDHVRFSTHIVSHLHSQTMIRPHTCVYRCTTPLPSTVECLSRSRPKAISGSTTTTQLMSPPSPPPPPFSLSQHERALLFYSRAHTGHGDCVWHRIQTGAR